MESGVGLDWEGTLMSYRQQIATRGRFENDQVFDDLRQKIFHPLSLALPDPTSCGGRLRLSSFLLDAFPIDTEGSRWNHDED